MRIEIRGRNVEMTDDLREMVRKRFQRLGPAGFGPGDARRGALGGAQPLDRRQPGGRGDLLPQGRDPARARGLAGDDPHRARTGRGRAAPGQEAPRPAAQAPPDPPAGRPDARPACRACIRSAWSTSRRAKVTATTPAAPAARSARAQALRVAPVVSTSSTSITLRGRRTAVACIRGGWPIRSAAAAADLAAAARAAPGRAQRRVEPLGEGRRQLAGRDRSRGGAAATAPAAPARSRRSACAPGRATGSGPPSGRRPGAGGGTSAPRRGRGRPPHAAPRTRRGRDPGGPLPSSGSARVGEPATTAVADDRARAGRIARRRAERRARARRRRRGGSPCPRS